MKQQTSDKLIQESDYHTKIRKQGHLKPEQSQQTTIPVVNTETKSKEIKIQTKKLESRDNITYTTENTEQNNRKDLTGKTGINNRVQNVGEIIEDTMPVEITHIQAKAKQQ